MWIGSTSLSELESHTRWKVEIFLNSAFSIKSESAFEHVRLGKLLVERKETLSPQDYPETLFNYIGLENIESLTGDLVKFSPKSGNDIRSRSKIFRQNDILYGRLRPYLNKVYLAESSVEEGICSGEFYVLKSDITLASPRYLREVLASEYILQHVDALQSGSALPRLRLDDLLDFEIPLPSLEFQKRLDEFLVEAHRKRLHLRAELEFLTQSINNALIESLETGSDPKIGICSQLDRQEYRNPLPIDMSKA